MQNEVNAAPASVRIVGSHGYRIDGDTAVLNADLAVGSEAHREHWALQLWACDRPHEGGPLSGQKVAEAPIDLGAVPDGRPRALCAEAPARFPATRRDYSMVLVVASGTPGSFEQVLDFVNFPERQPFLAPHFDGSVGYAIDGGEVTLRAERVFNPRGADNLSGSLSLQLRAVPAQQADGGEAIVLATAFLGRVAGGSAIEGVAERAAFSPPPPGEWRIVLVLLEWTAVGLEARDRCAFEVTYRAASAPVPQSARRVSIQDATLEELAAVKGLTRKLALEIVRARPFRSFDEIVRVRGIGEKTARKLRDSLTL